MLKKYTAIIMILSSLVGGFAYLGRPYEKRTLTEQQAREEAALRIVNMIDRIEVKEKRTIELEAKRAILKEFFDEAMQDVVNEYNVVYEEERTPAGVNQ